MVVFGCLKNHYGISVKDRFTEAGDGTQFFLVRNCGMG